MASETRVNKLIVTSDGSNSIFSEQFNCTYHSVHGAIQESRHIFINCGLDHFAKNTGKSAVNILEFGFGTGLNALLSLKYSVDNKINIDYSTIEAFPLSSELISKLNYLTEKELNMFKEEFFEMHLTNRTDQKLNAHFTFSKYNTRFEDYIASHKYDVIYFDAFGPDEQPELWDRPFLDKIPDLLNENGILVTYSVRGFFKRALKDLGFKINKLQGPPGKREILRAEKL